MRRIITAAFGSLLAYQAHALQPGPNDTYVRVVDVGPGLCTVTEVPGGHYMVYDAGHWNGKHCIKAVRDIVDGEDIDLIVISHSDSDHLGDADDILSEFNVKRIIRTGYQRWDTANWRNLNDKAAEEVKYGASVMNLGTHALVPGTMIQLGSATVTLVAGWNDWPHPGPTASEKRNAISIVVKLEYQGKSVLFTGDTVGRRKSDPVDACKDAERSMVDNDANVPLKSDVLIAPHHGGNNGSAKCFVEAVDPQFVIFSAGHKHDHPSNSAAQRYLDHGIPRNKILRTDRGDNEGGFEWPEQGTTCKDKAGDDDVDIVLSNSGAVSVAHRQSGTGCP